MEAVIRMMQPQVQEWEGSPGAGGNVALLDFTLLASRTVRE